MPTLIEGNIKTFVQKITCPRGLTGSVVRITQIKDEILHMAEVEVYSGGQNDNKYIQVGLASNKNILGSNKEVCTGVKCDGYRGI